MPNLQKHMLRVTAVAKTIADNCTEKLDKQLITSVGLLHDLGNMAKIKLDRFPEFTQPEGMEYWTKILKEFKRKYGSDDYAATYKILKELGVPQNIYDLVTSLEFAKSPQTAISTNKELKIVLYSDARVSPNGVVSLKDRLNEVKDRYMKNKGISKEKFNQISDSLYEIEKQTFRKCAIKPNDITEEKVQLLFEELENFEIIT